METGYARNRDDGPGLPTLSLGLNSVRNIVNKLEAQYAGCIDTNVIETDIVKYDPCVSENNENYNISFVKKRSSVNRFVGYVCYCLNKCIPSVTYGNFGALAVATGYFAPTMISYLVLYPFCRLVFGTLYPAYASYKAVRTKNLKEYVKWMMYWIVFALFTCTETFTDVFLSWFPFYYEVKIVLVLWLLSPATKGSSILYRKFVHPALCRREQEIDEYIAKAKDQGYHTVLNLGTKGVNYATTVIMQTAIKGGGGLVQQLRKSYSLSDLTECEPREERGTDEGDDVLAEPRLIRRAIKSGYAARRSASESNSRSPMYFPEVDVDVRTTRTRIDEPDFSHIKSTEDISSGYSSADNSASLTRTGSVGAGGAGAGPRARLRTSARTTVTTIKRPQAAEGNEVIIEELHDDPFDYSSMPSLIDLQSQIFLSDTVPPFLYQYIGDQVKIVQILGNIIKPTRSATTDNCDKKDQQNDDSLNGSLDIGTETFDTNESEENLDDIPKDCNIATKDEINIPCENLCINTRLNIQAGLDNSSKEIADNDQYTSVPPEESPIQDTNNAFTSDRENELDGDDEVSFGTPEPSPTIHKKSKGKYGKNKAPEPPLNDNLTTTPIVDNIKENIQNETKDVNENETNSPESESGEIIRRLDVEHYRRRKSKSPIMPKGNASALGKLLQLPGKLVFWNKADDKSKSDLSSSEDESHSSEQQVDNFQSCIDINKLVATDVSHSTEKIENTEETDNVNKSTNELIETSDALQKLIDAKLETHPEYKYISLHKDVATTSKSTDV